MGKTKPTRERLFELFDYDPGTGIFTRKIPARTWALQDSRKYGAVGAGRVTELGNVMLPVDGVNYSAGPIAWFYVHGIWPRRIKYINGKPTDLRIENISVHDREADKIKADPLTVDRLKSLLHYDPETGWFTWKVLSAIYAIGDRAGGMHGRGYRVVGVDYKRYLEHALAWFYMTGEWPYHEIDHINGDKRDNRWVNLRDVTRSVNSHNKPRSRQNKSGFPGVYWHGNRVRARIDIDGKTIDFGRFATVAEARVARLLGEIEHFGHFTTFVAGRDEKLPVSDGVSIRIEAVATDVGGTRVDALRAYNHHGVPFFVKSAETITGIIAAMKEAP